MSYYIINNHFVIERDGLLYEFMSGKPNNCHGYGLFNDNYKVKIYQSKEEYIKWYLENWNNNIDDIKYNSKFMTINECRDKLIKKALKPHDISYLNKFSKLFQATFKETENGEKCTYFDFEDLIKYCNNKNCEVYAYLRKWKY